jgi:nickel-dependent lactate racemase
MSQTLPQMFHLYQRYPSSRQLEFDTLLRDGLESKSLTSELKPGMRVAVGVGSRGIANLVEIVTAVLNRIRASGAKPFIVPAMGSHGWATPSGQEHLLAEFGITPESTLAHFETSMDVEQIGQFGDRYPVVFSSAALKADAVVLINRIKPHTDFAGNLGSGIQKMLVIGFGKHAGASNAHRAASQLGRSIPGSNGDHTAVR